MEKNLESDWLARWTIIEQRWPALAGHLVDEPDDIAQLRKKPTKAALEKMAETLKPFAGHKDILRVIKDGGKNALTADHIRIITGGAGV